MLLLLNQLVEKMDGVPRSTISDWIRDYHMFIPVKMDGQTKYYPSEVIDILKEIQRLKNKGMKKPNIITTLEQSGFAVTIDQAETALQDEWHAEVSIDKRQDLVDIMQRFAQTLSSMHENDKRAERQEAILMQQQNIIMAQNRRIEELEKQMMMLAEPKKKPSFWSFFKKKRRDDDTDTEKEHARI